MWDLKSAKFLALGILLGLSTAALAQVSLPESPDNCEGDVSKSNWYLLDSGKAQRLPKPEVTDPSRPIQNAGRSLEWLFGESSQFHFEHREKKKIWSAGAVSGKFVLGHYLKTPDQFYSDIDYVHYLRALFNGVLGRIDGVDRPAWIKNKQVAFALHSEHGEKSDGAYWAIHGGQFEKYKNELPERLRQLPEQYFALIEKTYRERMKMDDATVKRLLKINREMMKRSIFLLKTKESFMVFGEKNKAEQALSSPLTVEAGLLITTSQGPEEMLPFEVLNNEPVPRLDRNSGDVGRFVVRKGSGAYLGIREMQAAATALIGLGIREAKCEADILRSELFMKRGWQIQLERPSNWAGEPERILTGDPEILTNRVLMDEMKAPMYRFDNRQQALLWALGKKLGGRKW